MALIKCGDCGKEISSDAEKCLYCGKPKDSIIEGVKMEKSLARGTIGFYKVFIIIMFSIIGLFLLATRFYLGVVFVGLILYFILKKMSQAQDMLKK